MKSSLLSRLCPWLAFGLLALTPLFLNDFRMSLLGQFLAFSLVAIGIDLIWGYTGILSLGHAVYFGLGAYCTAMFLKLEVSKGALPDFMEYGGLTALPMWWKPFHNGLFAIAMSMIFPACVAALLGYFTFKNRIKGVFFSILSQALSIITVTFFVGQLAYTGGTNGITAFSTAQAFGRPISDKSIQTMLFYVSLIVVMAAFFGCKKLVSGKFGQILLAIRDGENRLRFTGYNPTAYKVFIYAFSAALSGLGGALYAPQVGIVSPSQMDIVTSIGMVLWVAIGGRGTISGAVLGAILVNSLQNVLSETYPEYWNFFIGAAFVLVVLFLPKGVMGLIGDLQLKTRSKKTSEAFEAEAVTA